MKLLLDTHTWLWWLEANPALATSARTLLAAGQNPVFISAASIWELSIKRSIGKLNLPGKLKTHVDHGGFTLLPIQVEHAEQVSALPWHHRDPFDRMLIAQAQIENLTLVTRDDNIRRYDVAILPA